MSKEMAKKEEAGLAVPDYLKQYAGEGASDISAQDLERSFLQMAHEDKENVKFGEWYDSTTGESYGKEVAVTVCRIHRSWRKFNNDFQLETSSEDGISWDNGEKLTDDEKWQCAFIDCFVLLNDSPSLLPYIVSFKSTSFKTAKKLCTSIAKFTAAGEPMFARSYTLYTEEAKKGSKTYAVAKYKLNPGFNSEELVTSAAKTRKMLENVSPVITELADDEPQDFEVELD